MNAIEFKDYIEIYLDKIAKISGVTDLDKYYKSTDLKITEIKSLKSGSIEQVYAQFIFHTQNATIISNIVKFLDNFKFIKKVTYDFNPKKFLTEYEYNNEKDRNQVVSKIIENLKYDEINKEGLNFKEKDTGYDGTIIGRFANSLIDGAVYLEKFKNRQEVINDFNQHFKYNKELITYTRSQFKHGFSVALCCDFLKELDPQFDLPKPDVHIMETLAKYKGYKEDYYKNSDSKAFECINDFRDLVDDIKKTDNTMTAYKLDRQIWLCCTGNFFLDKKFDIKELFIDGIK